MFVVVADPELNRAQFFVRAAAGLGVPGEIHPNRAILADEAGWRERLGNRRVRLDSTGRDFAVETALLRRGAEAGVETGLAAIPAENLCTLERDPGRLLATRQWYLGWRSLLGEIAAAGAAAGAKFFNTPADIAVMFDKRASHARLRQAGVSVPRALPPPSSFDELIATMRDGGMRRVFAKTSHGSGANGVVALATDGVRWQAHTALEIVRSDGETRLYSTRRMRTYGDLPTLRALLDALCRERVHVEAWVPKAGVAGRTADARVVVIGGHACHLVLRLAASPITNLHLGAHKAGEELLTGASGRQAVALLRATAEQAAACFPDSLCVGVDVALTPDFRHAFVLEVNAFGDLLEDVTWRGADTYTWQLRAALGRDWPPS